MPHHLPEALVTDRFMGCILGEAVGDALGLPFEGCEPERITEMFPTPETLSLHHFPIRNFRLGQYSDDTQMMRCVLDSLVAHRELNLEDVSHRLVKLWETDVIGAGDACSIAVANLRRGVSWQESGAPKGQAGNGSTMRTAPLGLWYADEVSTLVEKTKQLSLMTHKDERSTAGAIVISLAVAHLLAHDPEKRFKPKALVDLVVPYVQELNPHFAEEIAHFPKRLKEPPGQALREIRRAGQSADKHTPWPGISGYVIPTILAVLDAFGRSPKNFRKSLWCIMSYGGDVDTTGALTGVLSGTFNGFSAIPYEWARQVHDNNQFGYDYLIRQAKELFQLKNSN